jgi:hypothetical protein
LKAEVLSVEKLTVKFPSYASRSITAAKIQKGPPVAHPVCQQERKATVFNAHVPPFDWKFQDGCLAVIIYPICF